MADTEYKKVSIGEQYLTQGKSAKRTNRSSGGRTNKRAVHSMTQVNPNNIKELLLQKLKQYKKEKTRKNNKGVGNSNGGEPPINPNFLKNQQQRTESRIDKPSTPSLPSSSAAKEPVLPSPPLAPRVLLHNDNYGSVPKAKPLKEKIELRVEKRFKLGRNITQKKVGVFIKNGEGRRKTEEMKRELRKSNLKTVKNYLKTNNLIKYGSCAPSELLREIYDTSKMCGDICNVNGKSLLHNYLMENK